jgi:hypothetical protein
LNANWLVWRRRGGSDFSDQFELETSSFFRENVIKDNIDLQTNEIFGLFDINCSLNFSRNDCDQDGA